jgi:hypothetical protein
MEFLHGCSLNRLQWESTAMNCFDGELALASESGANSKAAKDHGIRFSGKALLTSEKIAVQRSEQRLEIGDLDWRQPRNSAVGKVVLFCRKLTKDSRRM